MGVVVNKSTASTSLLISAMEFFVPEAATSALDLEAKSPPRWRDTLFLFVFGAFFYVARSVLDRLIFEPFARRCLFGCSDSLKSKCENKSSSSSLSPSLSPSPSPSPSLGASSCTAISTSSSPSSPSLELKKRSAATSTPSSDHKLVSSNGYISDNDDNLSNAKDNLPSGHNSVRRRRRRRRKEEEKAGDSFTSSSPSSPTSLSSKQSKNHPPASANGRRRRHVDDSSSSSPPPTPTWRAALPLANGHIDETSLPPPPPPPAAAFPPPSSPNCQSLISEKTRVPLPSSNNAKRSEPPADRDPDLLPPSSSASKKDDGEEEKEEEDGTTRRRRSLSAAALASTKSPPEKTMTTTINKERKKKKELEKMTEEEKANLLRKFKEACWRVVYYISSEIIFFSITLNEPWFGNTSAFWEGWPLQDVKLKLKAFYMYAGGYCLYSCFSLFLWDARRSDFFVTVCHHATTILLILFSYVNSFSRVGSIVLALHDANDIFLETAKIFVYTKVELGSTIFFSLFVICWLTLRLIYFPFWIIYSTTIEVLQALDVDAFPQAPYLYYFFNSLLITLLVLNLYWWLLISRMVIRMVKNKGEVGEDVREEEE